MRTVILLMLLSLGTAHAQCLDSLWRQAPSSAGGDWASALIAAPDGNAVIAGYMEYGTSPWFARANLRKLQTTTGQDVWSRTFVNLGQQDYFMDVTAVSGGGYLCLGISRTPTTLTQNIWLLRVNENGDSLWSRTIANGLNLQGRAVARAQDGGFGIAGRAQGLPGGIGSSDWFVIKTNSNGDSLWTVIIGDSLEDTSTDIITTSQGDFLVLGWSLTDTSRNGRAALVSQSGQVLWDRQYTYSSSIELYGVMERADGGYWITGATSPPNGTNRVLLAELDGNGTTVWQREHDLLPDRNDVAFGLTPDGLGGAYLFGSAYRNSTQEADAFVAHVSECGELVSTKFVGDLYNENIRGGGLFGDRVVISGGVTLENAQQDMLIYGLSADSCNGAPCAFRRVSPADSAQPEWSWPLPLTWTRATDPEGDPLSYIFHLEHTYFPEAVWPTDTVVTDTFVHVEINIPVEQLDELYEFRWRVWATDAQDTVEAANGEGFFTIEITDAGDVMLTPRDFALAAFPNPFNPTTTLTYILGLSGHATLALYDVRGRHVATLHDGFAPAGTHALQFDGSRLASGVYFAQLRSGHAVRTAKLMLIK